jgi:two-component system chemotaxis response regulator CheY
LARVLIADDAAFVRKVLREMLAGAGHDVVAEAATGEEAVSAYHDVRPDIAVLDVNMPVLDGLAAAEAIKTAYPAAKLILASVLVHDSRVRRAVALQAVLLTKPFDSSALLDAVETLCPVDLRRNA